MSTYIDVSPEELKWNFDIYDRDGSGSIQISEMQEIFARNGAPLNESAVTYLMNKYDKNRDGKIDFYEFAEYVTGKPFRGSIPTHHGHHGPIPMGPHGGFSAQTTHFGAPNQISPPAVGAPIGQAGPLPPIGQAGPIGGGFVGSGNFNNSERPVGAGSHGQSAAPSLNGGPQAFQRSFHDGYLDGYRQGYLQGVAQLKAGGPQLQRGPSAGPGPQGPGPQLPRGPPAGPGPQGAGFGGPGPQGPGPQLPRGPSAGPGPQGAGFGGPGPQGPGPQGAGFGGPGPQGPGPQGPGFGGPGPQGPGAQNQLGSEPSRQSGAQGPIPPQGPGPQGPRTSGPQQPPQQPGQPTPQQIAGASGAQTGGAQQQQTNPAAPQQPAPKP